MKISITQTQDVPNSMCDEELIRKALMGDGLAQDTCTEKGILLPCPYCGGTSLKIDSRSKEAGYCGYDDRRVDNITYSVRCNKCHARGASAGGKVVVGLDAPPHWAHTRKELEKGAIKNWNTRLDPPVGRCITCGNRGKCEIEGIGGSVYNWSCSDYTPEEE